MRDLIDKTETLSELPSVEVAKVMRPRLAELAQKQYDDWQQDENGYDEELGSGGICHLIAEDFATALSAAGVDAYTTTDTSVQHVYIVAPFAEGVFTIDVPYSIYERGAVFTWTKIKGVTFDPSDVVIMCIDRDPGNLATYVDDLE